MNEIKSEACERFMALLDQYMDGMAQEEDVSFMQAHAAQCASCREQWKLTREMMNVISGLDDNVSVPLTAQNAWRQAVRREAKNRKISRVTRWASGIAAALVLALGSFGLLRDAKAPAANGKAAEVATYRRIAVPTVNEVMARGVMPNVLLLESDESAALVGGADELASDLKQRSAVMESEAEEPAETQDADVVTEDRGIEEVPDTDGFIYTDETAMMVRTASVVAGVNDFEQGRRDLGNLTEEYIGYFASDIAEYSENGAQRLSRTVIRVPVDLLDEFLTALENISDVHSVEVKTDSVGEFYYDAESRLSSQRLLVDRLNELIPVALGGELEGLNRLLQEAYDRIDELERTIRAYQGEVRYAAVSVELYEITDQAGVPGGRAVPAPTSEPSLAERSASGFRQSMAKIGRFLEEMIVSVAIIAPMVLIVAAASVVAGVTIWIVRRKKRNHSAREE